MVPLLFVKIVGVVVVAVPPVAVVYHCKLFPLVAVAEIVPTFVEF